MLKPRDNPPDLLMIAPTKTPDELDLTAREVTNRHRADGRFMLGYHVLITRDGMMHLGRDYDLPGGVDRRWDQRAIYVGLVCDKSPSLSQLAAAGELILSLEKAHGSLTTFGHTSGNTGKNWRAWYNQTVKGRLVTPAKSY